MNVLQKKLGRAVSCSLSVHTPSKLWGVQQGKGLEGNRPLSHEGKGTQNGVELVAIGRRQQRKRLKKEASRQMVKPHKRGQKAISLLCQDELPQL